MQQHSGETATPDGTDGSGSAPAEPADAPIGPKPSRLRELYAHTMALTVAVANVNPAQVEAAAQRFGSARPYLAPIAWATGTLVLLLRGVKMLILNWRLLLIQLVPAAWIWVAMYDLKQHGLRGAPFRELNLASSIVLSALAIAWTIAAFWCNTVFAFAIDGPPPPLIRPAIRRTNRRFGTVVLAGAGIGAVLAAATVLVPRLDRYWVFVITLGGTLTVMFTSFVAVPAYIIGRRKQKLPPRQYIGRTVTGWGVSAVGMLPGVLLDRLGLIMIGTPGLHVLGFVVLSAGVALYAAGMSTVKAVSLSIKLGDDDGQPDSSAPTGAPADRPADSRPAPPR